MPAAREPSALVSSQALAVFVAVREDDLNRIKRVVAGYPDAPPGVENFHWITVPRYWDRLRVPTDPPREVLVLPHHEDQHAGIRFRVGWDAREQVVALWLL